MNVLTLALGRLPRLLLTVFIVCTSVFFIIAAVPGKLAVLILGADNATPEAIRLVEQQLHLDRPILVRYTLWLGDLLHGNLGYSYVQNANVASLIVRYLPATLELLAIAIVLALAIAIPSAFWRHIGPTAPSIGSYRRQHSYCFRCRSL